LFTFNIFDLQHCRLQCSRQVRINIESTVSGSDQRSDCKALKKIDRVVRSVQPDHRLYMKTIILTSVRRSDYKVEKIDGVRSSQARNSYINSHDLSYSILNLLWCAVSVFRFIQSSRLYVLFSLYN